MLILWLLYKPVSVSIWLPYKCWARTSSSVKESKIRLLFVLAFGMAGLRVIVVGASVSGLTLANALDRAGLDFVVLEQQKDITEQTGASIVIFPNGYAPLEQLGLYEDIEKASLPMTTNNSRSGHQSQLIRQFNAFHLMTKR